jgi:hypothetical protein
VLDIHDMAKSFKAEYALLFDSQPLQQLFPKPKKKGCGINFSNVVE